MILLETEKLGIRFGGLAAVWDVDVQVKTGETVGLIGPNGSGKTTFFNLLTGINIPIKGKILFQNKNLVGFPPHKIAENGISRTFQNSRLFSGLSVLDNILVGMNLLQKTNIFDAIFKRDQIRIELRGSVNEVLNLIKYFGKDLEQRSYQKVKDLPLADKKRVEICRAIVSKPKLLLLDEPSAGMNPEETSELMEDLVKIREKEREMSIILIEHDMRVIKGVAQRVVVLNHGEKIFEGTFEEASHNKQVKEAYLGTGE
jgi:branched-chain amino acid transport system ATP-binding protein